MSAETDTATYEVTIAGAVGPVLRWALRPQVVAPPHGCTIVRVKAADRVGLVELLRRLDSAGLEVESVAELSHHRSELRLPYGGQGLASSSLHDARETFPADG